MCVLNLNNVFIKFSAMNAHLMHNSFLEHIVISHCCHSMKWGGGGGGVWEKGAEFFCQE